MKNQVQQSTAAGKLTDLRSPRACGVAITFIAFLGVLFFASAASAAPTEGAGWEAYSQSFPTNLRSGRATDEVREFKISGTSGEFRLEAKQGDVNAKTFGETPLFAFDATHEEVQTGLEAVFGAGNVVVSGGPGDAMGTKPYFVTFTGSLSDQPVNYPLVLQTAGSASGAQPVAVTAGRADGQIQLDLFNTGAKLSEGSITVTDTLPAGLTAIKAGGMPTEDYEFNQGTQIFSTKEEEQQPGGVRWVCTGNGSGEASLAGATVLTCTSNPTFLPSLPLINNPTGPSASTRIGIAVRVEANAKEGTKARAEGNRVTIAGGGAASAASASDPVTISSSEPVFGFPGWDVWFSNADGSVDRQAGSHPYEATFVNGFNELADGRRAGGEPRDLEADLPPGFFGDPGAVPRCTPDQLDSEECPAQSQIGVDEVGIANPRLGVEGGVTAISGYPVYNVLPPPGVPDEFGFSEAGYDVTFDAGVRSSHGYPIVEHINNIPEVNTDLNVLTLWGVPAEASHTRDRCEGRFKQIAFFQACRLPSEILPKPFLTLPTSCEGPQPFTLLGLSTYENENAKAAATVFTHEITDTEAGFTGCEKLSLLPSFSAVPDTAFADTPAGLTAEVKIPQETLELPNGLVPATLKNTKVTLPEGLVINPGQAAGLAACQAAEANLEGDGPQHCPSASKVGTVKIQTPLLEEELEPELEGNVYVLQSNPPELKLLVAASADGINLKLVGTVSLNEVTGQVTTTFTETPELPFTDFKLSFSGGAQAALATPTQCGTYSTSSDFTPWTTKFAADVFGSDGFTIGAGPLGAACPSGPLPFHPSLIAGATTDQAGGYTSFSLLLQRGDDQQRIEKLQFKAPAGLTGEISHVTPCPEPQAQAGTCSAASQIGHTTVASGTGPFPLIVPEPGRPESPIYLTGPYEGAPFGLSIVTPVLTGPFNLGTIITRAKIEVDPHTAAITVTTDPLPQIIDGVPTDLRTVDSVIDRPEFMVNPTNCNPQEFSGTATGTPPPGAGGPGATAPISSHFQVGSCQSLKFAPQFKVSTRGKTSKALGASLTSTVTYPSAVQGTYANVTRVKVDLPKQLPSRLTTLQKACTNAQFELNPANCPSASKIGYATVHTPLLPVPLVGPAIFVSHGGEAFPSLTMVLQGDNVTIDLVGTTNISKAGITSTTFKTLPDSPFSSFELTLPEGKFSALAANGNLCTSKLAMPTEFLGQNGFKINESTKISVTGCAKVAALTRAQKLKKALKACRKEHSKGKRAKCEKQARKQYGPGGKAKKKAKRFVNTNAGGGKGV
jgi:hypothetical protein